MFYLFYIFQPRFIFKNWKQSVCVFTNLGSENLYQKAVAVPTLVCCFAAASILSNLVFSSFLFYSFPNLASLSRCWLLFSTLFQKMRPCSSALKTVRAFLTSFQAMAIDETVYGLLAFTVYFGYFRILKLRFRCNHWIFLYAFTRVVFGLAFENASGLSHFISYSFFFPVAKEC